MSHDLQLPVTHDACRTVLKPVWSDLLTLDPLPNRHVRFTALVTLTWMRTFELVPNGEEYQVVEIQDGKRVDTKECIHIDDDLGLWEIVHC